MIERQRNLRIAVYHQLPEGGAKRALYHQLQQLGKSHHVHLYTSQDTTGEKLGLSSLVEETHIFKYQPHTFPSQSLLRFFNPTSFLIELPALDRYFRHLAKSIDKENYDAALICHGLVTTPYLLKYLETPTVYYCQEPFRQGYEYLKTRRPKTVAGIVKGQLSKARIDERILVRTLRSRDIPLPRLANLVLCNSSFSKNQIDRVYGVSAVVNYLGVDIERFRPLGLPRCGNDGHQFVLSVGEIHPRKGFDLIVRALARLPHQKRPRLVIVCFQWDVREKMYLERMADEMSVSLEFVRNITDAELVELYNRAMATVFVPSREPFGFVPLESMACGTPVIGANEGGITESVLDGQTGFLVERDSIQIKNAIERLLDDAELVANMGLRGRQLVESKWTWERSVAELEEHLRSVCH